MRRYDVVVVGGGPAGASAAYHLAKDGARVLVVDAADVIGGRYKTCGGGYTEKLWWSFPRTAVGLVPEHTITRLRVGTPKLQPVEHDSDVPIAHMSMRSNMDRQLLSAAIDAGAKFQVSKVAAVSVNGRPCVRLQGEADLAADYVIGADGAHSLVARSLGFPKHRRQLVAVENEAYGQPRTDWSKTIEIFSVVWPPGYFWVFPKRDHLSTGVAAPPGSAKRLKRWAVDYTNTHLNDATHQVRGHQIPMRDPHYPVHREGVFLVGDAGGFVDPCTGEGIGWGALSGRRAAEAILAGDPDQFLHWVKSVDAEFLAARAFRNLLICRLRWRARQVLADTEFWKRFLHICAGQQSYLDWYRTLAPPLKATAKLINKLMPV